MNEIEEDVEERSHVISDAHEKVIEINSIVKSLEDMVVDQGTVLGKLGKISDLKYSIRLFNGHV
jgi:hypothetical protein